MEGRGRSNPGRRGGEGGLGPSAEIPGNRSMEGCPISAVDTWPVSLQPSPTAGTEGSVLPAATCPGHQRLQK